MFQKNGKAMLLTKIFQFARVSLPGLSLGLLAVGLGGCGGGGGGSGGSGVPTPEVNAIRIACIGDSITWGTDLKNREHDCYPAVLGRQLGTHYNVGNFGRSGSCVLTSLFSSYSNSPSYQQALAFQPKDVIILLGTNDSIRKPFTPAIQQEFLLDYKNLIAAFKKANPTTTFFVCLPTPNYAETSARKGNLHDNVLPLLSKIAAEEGATLIDLYTPLLGQPARFNNGVHPDKEGAAIIAAAVHNALLKTAPPAA